jgi:molecular chaperone GrpE
MVDDKDENPGPGTPANDLDGEPMMFDEEGFSSDQRLLDIESELSETKDQLLRAMAETENVRRRLQRDRDDAQKFAVSNFAKDLLSVADNLRRALDALPEDEVRDAHTKSMRDGVAATERELLAVFERAGLKRIDPAGERFDHNFHQAIFETERPGAAAGTVIEVLQPGYVLHDRLLRPAMVGVAKAGAAPSEGTGDAA